MEKENIYRKDSFGSEHGSTHSKSNASSGVTGLSQSASESHDSDQPTDARFQWKSQWQHAMFFLAYTTTWTSMSKVTVENEKTFSSQYAANIVQIMVVYIFFGCPVLFMEIFIGQFTQKGCLVLGEMMPVANGLGYFILLNTFVSGFLNLYHCVFLLFYVFVAMFNYPVPPWMICLSRYYNATPHCLGLNEIDQCEPCYSPNASKEPPCYDPNVHNLSAYMFFKYVVIDYDEMVVKRVWSPPSVKYCVHLLMTVALVSVVIVKSLRDLDGAVRIWNIFTITALVVMTTGVVFTSLRLQGLLFFFDMSWNSFFSLDSWVDAITMIVFHLKLFEGGNILFGSYTSVTVNTSARASYLCLIHFIIFLIFHGFLFLLLENLLCRMNSSISAFNRFSDEFFMMALYPEALGLLAASPIWGTLYFLIGFGVTVQTVALQVIVIEASLSAELINSSYSIYTRFIILLIGFSICLVLGSPKADVLIPYYISYLNILRLGSVWLFLCVIMLYGFQRLCDDVYFLLRFPPSFYHRMSWFVSLILSCIAFFYIIIVGNYKARYELTYTIISAMFLTLLTGFLVKFVKYLKARDLMSLLRQADAWGPSDVEAKRDRRLFNPRYEVRYRRKVEKCKHRCLLSSSVLKKTLEKELALVSNVLLEIEDNEEDKKYKQAEIENLRLHRACMSKFLAERAPDEIAFFFKKHMK